MTAYYFVTPTESLFVRGNLAFGDAGEHGAGLMPPPPSLFAGAFRSAMLARHPQALEQFTQKGQTDDPALNQALGAFATADGKQITAGRFRLSWVSLACQPEQEQATAIETVMPLPADLVSLESGLAYLTPGAPQALVFSGQPLPRTAVLAAAKQEKPLAGRYLRQAGLARHLAGELPKNPDCLDARDLYQRDPRLGIGLNPDTATVESGLIYTTEGFAFNPPDSPFAATGFLVGIQGSDDLLPDSGLLRLGGDGRAASYRKVPWQPPEMPLERVTAKGRFRLILQTPGLFANGWLPPGIVRENADHMLRGQGFSARLVCAAVPRREVISGWNLLGWRPKDAQRVAPAGSVYWFEDFAGAPETLVDWVNGGLWDDHADLSRRAEGYNLACLGQWT